MDSGKMNPKGPQVKSHTQEGQQAHKAMVRSHYHMHANANGPVGKMAKKMC